MSKYTTEVRFICEMKSGFPVDEMASHSPDEIISASRSAVFDFSYPIYETGHKPVLETKILKHYYTREIGAETVSLWKLWLNERLNLIMPKYNKLFAAEQALLDKALYNVDITGQSIREDDLTKSSDYTRTDNLKDTTDTTRTDELTDTVDSTTVSKDKYSDTPQGTVANVDNNTYLTDYRSVSTDIDETTDHTGTQETESETTHTGTQRNAGTDTNTGTQETNYSEHGYRGGKLYYEIMADYQEKILNIDQMIVNELSDLFIKLW